MMSFVSLLIVLLVVGLIVSFVIALLLAESLLHPPRMNDGKALYLYQRLSPADLDLPFTEVKFNVPAIDRPGKSIDIAGWWIESDGSSDRCIVLLHGYADARISAIGWAPLCRALGFNVLAIDLRAHGESGGLRCTAGVLEGSDVSAVLSQLQLRWPEQSRQLVLFGISMGATVALSAAIEHTAIAGIVLDSPYNDFVTTARRSADLRGMPSGITFTAAAWIAQRWVKIDYRIVRLSSLMARVSSPILWLNGDDDRIVGVKQRAVIAEAMRDRNRSDDSITTIVDADHLLGNLPLPSHAIAAVTEFMNRISKVDVGR